MDRTRKACLDSKADIDNNCTADRFLFPPPPLLPRQNNSRALLQLDAHAAVALVPLHCLLLVLLLHFVPAAALAVCTPSAAAPSIGHRQ